MYTWIGFVRLGLNECSTRTLNAVSATLHFKLEKIQPTLSPPQCATRCCVGARHKFFWQSYIYNSLKIFDHLVRITARKFFGIYAPNLENLDHFGVNSSMFDKPIQESLNFWDSERGGGVGTPSTPSRSAYAYFGTRTFLRVSRKHTLGFFTKLSKSSFG